VLDDLGLIAAIEWQTRQFENRTGITCELDLPKTSVHLSQQARTALFRILQESLTNVARHASASRVRVSLICDPDWTSLSVDDNGKGIKSRDLEDRHSFGLLGMRERAAVFGGTVEIRGETNAGTTIKVSLPSHTLNGDSTDDHVAYG
jgi:signal transduction histidine kinase